MIKLHFDQTVDIKEYYYPKFSLTTFLSELGGILGLWLGIGVMQIGGYGAIVMGYMKIKFKSKALF